MVKRVGWIGEEQWSDYHGSLGFISIRYGKGRDETLKFRDEIRFELLGIIERWMRRDLEEMRGLRFELQSVVKVVAA